MRREALLVTAALLAGCSTKLPDPDSAAAHLYRQRCGGCHRLYAPELLKADMWKYQVERMQGQMARRGIAPLTHDEQTTLLAYLQHYAGK